MAWPLKYQEIIGDVANTMRHGMAVALSTKITTDVLVCPERASS